MENNLNNKAGQTGDQNKGTTGMGGSSAAGSNSTSQRSNSTATGSTGSQSAQGKSNQQGTSGQDSMKNIQDMLQKYSGPITQKINGLSTTQKVVGGSLLALGAGWLALSSTNKNKIKSKAGALTSSAQGMIGGKKSGGSSTSRSGSSSSASDSNSIGGTSSRTGSSAVDARVK